MAKDSAKQPKKAKSSTKPVWLARPFVALGHYVRDSWRELKQVEWPSRKETWQLTFAVMAFSLFIGALVALCVFASQWIVRSLI